MRIPRIYTQFPLHIGCELEPERESIHHLVQVLRLKPGAALILFNGDGRDYQGQLLDCTRKSAKVAISGQSEEEPPLTLKINLGLGLSKGERMDFAVQKSVELGVTRINPLLTEHSVVRLTENRMENRLAHWKRIAIAACEQSGRCRLPEVGDALPLDEWLKKIEQFGGTGILLDHRSTTTLDQIACNGSTINLLIGPEGGLSAGERSLAKATGFEDVRLGPRVMRTETAPLAAISAMQLLWGDFRGS